LREAFGRVGVAARYAVNLFGEIAEIVVRLRAYELMK